jgi:outer membrane protein
MLLAGSGTFYQRPAKWAGGNVASAISRLLAAAWLITLPTVAATTVAVAADIPGPTLEPITKAPPASSDWLVTIGGEVRAVPAWPGSPTNLYGLTGIPLLAIQKPSEAPFFFGARDSFGIPIWDAGKFLFGAAGQINYPRYNSQYSQLNGMGEVNWALQLGAFAQYWALPWLRLRAELRQGIGGETGLTGDLFADVVVPVGQWRLSAGPRFAAQTAAAISPYFSVNATQSAATGLPVYNATGGFYSWGAGGQVEYFWTRQWSAHALVEYERISGSAANSPLVTLRGSPNQLTFGLGATYSFLMHPLW